MHQTPTSNQFPNLLQNDRLLVKMPPLPIISTQLQQALQYLTMHSLTHSAKWIGQLLLGQTTQPQINQSFLIRSFIHNNTNNQSKTFINQSNPNQQNPQDINTILLLSKNLFELRQYKKCIHMLKQYRIKYPNNQSVIFYYYYSIWMNGLIRKQQEIYENQNTGKVPSHPDIQVLDRQLKKLYQHGKLNGINLYLYGLILKEQQRLIQARTIFIESLNIFPYLWSCWLQLCRIIESQNLNSLITDLNDHWMKNLFFSSFCLEKYKNDMSIELNYGMLCFFKNSNFIMNQIAHSFYNNQQFDPSLDWFQKLLEIDPYRFENMDTYSNILYIKENQGELANLALRQFDNNKYNPETCCVIGNYYSLMGEHLKAIVYFRKALKLDRTCLAAWTLMGHEYLEMKNIPGAIEAYRNAVEIDPKDFRAWYGLGQTFQLQNMNHHALYYFNNAVHSRPKDARMWNAMGSCYQKIGKAAQAQKCYERAECSKDRQGIAIHQMARLYHTMGPQFEAKAVDAFQKSLHRKQQQQINDKQTADCLAYLNKYYQKCGNYQKANQYSRRLIDLQGIQKDDDN